MKISRTGLLCLALVWTSTLVRAQAPQDTAPPPSDQQPAAQQPAQQAPAQQPQQPPAAPQQPQQQPNPEATTPPEPRRLNLPPAPPKEADVRMPGEAGYYIGFTGWLPIGNNYTDKGHAAAFTDPSYLQLAGKMKASPGVEIGIAAGLHNSIHFSYFAAKQSGTTMANTETVIFSETYSAGDQLSTNAKLSASPVVAIAKVRDGAASARFGLAPVRRGEGRIERFEGHEHLRAHRRQLRCVVAVQWAALVHHMHECPGKRDDRKMRTLKPQLLRAAEELAFRGRHG